MGQNQSSTASSTSQRSTPPSSNSSPRQPNSRPSAESRASSPIEGNKGSLAAAGSLAVKSPEKGKTKRFKKRRPTTADSANSWTSISSTTETIRPTRSVSQILPPLDVSTHRNLSSESRSVSHNGRFQRYQEVENSGGGLFAREERGVRTIPTPPVSPRASPVQRESDPAIPEEWEQYRIPPLSPPLDENPFSSTGAITLVASTSESSSCGQAATIPRSSSSSSRHPVGHPANHHARFRRRQSSRSSVASTTSISLPSTPTRQIRERPLSTRRSEDSLLVPRRSQTSRPSLRSTSSRPSLRSSSSSSSLRLDEIVINVDHHLRPTQYGSQSSSASFPRSVSSFSSTVDLRCESKQPYRAASSKSLISLSEDGRVTVQEESDDEIEGEEEMGYRRSAPPPSSQSMGWADYSLCPTPRALQSTDSFRSPAVDTVSSRALRTYSLDSTISSVDSLGSIESEEEVEVRHVMSPTKSNSRFVVGTQYPATEVIQVEFGRSAFGGSTFKRTSDDSPTHPFPLSFVPVSTTTPQLLPSLVNSLSDSFSLGNSPIAFERPSTPRAEMNAKRYNSKRRSGPIKYSLRRRSTIDNGSNSSITTYSDDGDLSTASPSVPDLASPSAAVNSSDNAPPTTIDFGSSFTFPQSFTLGQAERGLGRKESGKGNVARRRVESTEKRGLSQREIKQWIGESRELV